MSPTNPGLGFLSVEASLGNVPTELAVAKRELTRIVNDIIAEVVRPEHDAMSLQEKVKLAYQVLWTYFGQADQESLLDGLQPQQRKLDCDTSCFVILAVAHEMLRLDPRWSDIQLKSFQDHAWLQVGDVYIDFGKYYSAQHYAHMFGVSVDTIRKLPDRPPLAQAYFVVGQTLKDHSKLEQAVAAYKKAIALDPQFADAYNNLGNAFAQQNKLNDAVAVFEQTLTIDPSFVYAWHNLGAALNEQGKFDEAVAASRRAISIDPAFFPAYYNLSQALRAQGNIDTAITTIESALANLPAKQTHLRHRLESLFQELISQRR